MHDAGMNVLRFLVSKEILYRHGVGVLRISAATQAFLSKWLFWGSVVFASANVYCIEEALGQHVSLAKADVTLSGSVTVTASR